ncbi:hypothetical protein BDU57DRAFT_459840 [Ampelomyces quisqualis]|uniref:T6SS Phospholipase effector Tle1-like catalytic domain-containing protein n=1 Tax=Ampelomyces quisqualis TaxID=50730 RepID=A0A6A5Q9Y6_AMPQU|nr:hypothetical protein BDU57DRAFT_459840 [Ampelomyces quisqualis]
MPPKDSVRPPKRLVIFCDGTWVGRETTVADAPASNIRQLANMVGQVEYNDATVQESTVHPIRVHDHVHNSPNIIAGYQEGVGLNRTFLEYVWDGATAFAIGDECISVYKFIVENYTDDYEIWLFGFSRGAFTVRCVAGMLNNCGIIKRRPEYTENEVQRLCYDVFRTYRSPLPQDEPHSDDCEHLKDNASHVWQVKRPIRFMGIIDTVGALGIPRFNAGIGFDWAPFEFFDQNVSSVVQEVYHAPALHDRLWIFQPCLIFPNPGPDQAHITQRWFPGTHYDVGRMTFRFVRQSPTNWLEGVLGWLPNVLSRTIYPNQVLSDCVLRFLLQGMQATDNATMIPDVDHRIAQLDARIASPAPNSTGSGDIYGNVLDYAPGGFVLGSIQRVTRSLSTLVNAIFPRLADNVRDVLGVKTLVTILTGTADRRIPGTHADVFAYETEQMLGVNGALESAVVKHAAHMEGVNEWGKERYGSKSWENYVLWKRVFGREGRRNGRGAGDG